jgi:hypothetical protein
MIEINNNALFLFTQNDQEKNFISSIQMLYINYPNEFNKLYNAYLDICGDYQIDLYKGKLLYVNKILHNILSYGNSSSHVFKSLLQKRLKYNINDDNIQVLLHIINIINNNMPYKETGLKYFMNVALNVYANTPIR